MRTAIFWHYTQHQNALPPENVMSFSIFFAAKESLVKVWKIHEVSGSYHKSFRNVLNFDFCRKKLSPKLNRLTFDSFW